VSQSTELGAISFVIGILTGLTGVGGGALLTPILILLGIPPLAAVSNDLVASLLIKPFGAVVHLRRRTVDMRLLLWLCVGSVPAGFSGALLLALLPSPQVVNSVVRTLVGAALALTAVLLVLRLGSRQPAAVARDETVQIRRWQTVAVGAVAGLLVGLTSIGSGSIIAAGILLLYPRLATGKVVGTDVAHAIPLVGAATVGHLLFGQVHMSLAVTLVIGGVPGILIGSYLAGSVPNTALRAGLAVLLVATATTLLSSSVPLVLTASAATLAVLGVLAAVRASNGPRVRVEEAAERPS
jgi:uncharacterized membrane protein YfcA